MDKAFPVVHASALPADLAKIVVEYCRYPNFVDFCKAAEKAAAEKTGQLPHHDVMLAGVVGTGIDSLLRKLFSQSISLGDSYDELMPAVV